MMKFYIFLFLFYRWNAHVLKETLIFLLCGVYFKFSFLIDLLIMAFQADMWFIGWGINFEENNKLLLYHLGAFKS